MFCTRSNKKRFHAKNGSNFIILESNLFANARYLARYTWSHSVLSCGGVKTIYDDDAAARPEEDFDQCVN